jgi:hypothetical protein
VRIFDVVGRVVYNGVVNENKAAISAKDFAKELIS